MTTKKSTRAEALASFNSKLADVKHESSETHKSTFPDFASMQRKQESELKQRKQEIMTRNHIEATKSHIPHKAAEYRGAGASQLACRRNHPNLATNPSELSVPIKDKKIAEYTEKLQKGGSLGKKTSDVCSVETHLRLTVGTNFSPALAKTHVGWKPGMFS